MQKDERIQNLERMGQKYLDKFVKDAGYGHTGKIGNCVGYEVGARLNGIWLKLDVGIGKIVHVYRHCPRGRNH